MYFDTHAHYYDDAFDPDRDALLASLPARGLALAVCLGGNASLVGAAANLVTVGIAEKNGHQVGFMDFLKYGVPVTLGSMVLASAYILARYYVTCTA